jgi:hypothetical protein
VAARHERRDEPAFVIEEPHVAFGHDELVLVTTADDARHDADGDRDD